MKLFPVVAGAALALTLGACSGTAEDEIENSIRTALANKTNVDQVEMNKQADGNMTGYVLTHENDGRKGRLKCSATPEADSKYKWECSPAIDAETERQMQELVRAEFAKQGEVLAVDMKRKDDDNHMAGSAKVRTADGTEHDLTCTAERQPNMTFTWSCQEAGAAAQTGSGDDSGGEE